MGYFSTRLSSLIPRDNATRPNPNVIRLLRSLSAQEWAFYSVGFLSWTFDALDFHTVTQTYRELGITFGKSPAEISIGVTLVLVLRPLGAVIFGTAADIFGRKWPLVCNLVLIIIFEACTGFCETYSQFLAVRALFGIAMGGIYGNAAATALEDCREEARGLLSGGFQSGYSVGFLIAVLFWKAFEGTRYGWRSLFWLSSCLPLLLIVIRIRLPESQVHDERTYDLNQGNGIRGIFDEVKIALRRHWLLMLYMALFMAGFSFMSHGSQDLYTLMLQFKYSYQNSEVTVIQVVANLGAISGGVIMGYFSQILGRRLCIVVLCVCGSALIYPYTLAPGPGIYVAAFLEQFCIQGAFGVIPIHLLELSPPIFRTFFVGTSYQLGVLIASASNTIETRIGEQYPLPPTTADGKITLNYDYSLVMCIFMACTFVYVIIVTIIGPERPRRSMAIRNDDESDWIDPFELRDLQGCEEGSRIMNI